MDESKLQIQTHSLADSAHPVTQYIYPCSGCKSRVTRNSREELLAAFTSATDGQFMRSCQRCRAKGIQNRKRRREELNNSNNNSINEEDEDDEHGHAAVVDFQSRCTIYEDFTNAVEQFMATHDMHPEFDVTQPAARFRITLMSETVLPRTESCPARTVDAVTRDTHESQKLAALMLRDALFDATGYFFQLRKGGRPHPDGGKYNFSCSRAEERKGAYDRTKRMREGGGVRQRRTKTREFFRCEGRVMMCFSRTNSWITIAYAHKAHSETPKIHDKKEKAGQQQQQQQQTHGLLAVQQHMQLQGHQQIDPALMGAEALTSVAQQHHNLHQLHGLPSPQRPPYAGQFGGS
ncbi:uncharacterized protein V2V93DRAFT_341723 [Kockiozyma suomiensis]|uniref:uncharacterized protein n=1 Tax=Kockiozyma suomiensis TaxID=1337062 RepID=UPI0033437711